MKALLLLLLPLLMAPQAQAQEFHNISYFTVEDVFIPMGTAYDLKVVLANYYNRTDNVSLFLSSYDLARFTSVEGDHTWLSSDHRQVRVENVLTNETRELNVRVFPKPVPKAYSLRLIQAPALSPLADQDEVTILVGYPASFPGMGVLGASLVISLAVLCWKKRLNTDQ